jgi:hypothetical protein
MNLHKSGAFTVNSMYRLVNNGLKASQYEDSPQNKNIYVVSKKRSHPNKR